MTPVSFLDGVVRNKQVDLFQQNLLRIEYEDGNKLLLRVFYMEDRIFQELCGSWEDSIVIELLSKTIGYGFLKEKLTII